MKKTTYTAGTTMIMVAAALMLSPQLADAAFVININQNYGTAIVSNFQTADAALPNSSDLFNLNGSGAFTSADLTSGALTITTTGAPHNDGYDTNFGGNPILEGNLFDVGGNLGLVITGLASLDLGDMLVLTAWGIGDSDNQDTSFTGVFGGDSQSASSTFSTTPFVQFTFTADGTTDILTLDAAPGPGGQNRSHFSGASLSITAVPEPSSVALLGLGGIALILRRRK